MGYFQEVVAEYLRADRACFINTEFYLQNDLSEDEEAREKHWFVDILALHMRHKTAYLCEVTYAKHPKALLRRLSLWQTHWNSIRDILRRDACVPVDYRIRPWVFVPERSLDQVKPILQSFDPVGGFYPLEKVVPWEYANHVLQHDDF